MGRRYYCDYCDKSFLCTPDAVKKHIKSSQHQHIRKEYYAQFEDKRTIIKNNYQKNPCIRYKETGQCPFGMNCKYSHYTKQELDAMKWEVEQMDNRNRNYIYDTNKTFKSWLLERKRQGLSNSKLLEQAFIDVIKENDDLNVTDLMEWNYPNFLEYIPNLPPSLKKITLSDVKGFILPDWG